MRSAHVVPTQAEGWHNATMPKGDAMSELLDLIDAGDPVATVATIALVLAVVNWLLTMVTYIVGEKR